MDKVSNLISNVLKKRGLGDQAAASYTVFLANEWIAQNMPSLADRAKAVSLSGQVLTLEVSHSQISQEIYLHTEELLHHLNRYEGITVSSVRVLWDQRQSVGRK